jgi:hypothetical protein
MDGFRISTTNPPEQITDGYPHRYLAEENGLYKWQGFLSTEIFRDETIMR